jgi:hypothetical protein
LSWGWIEEIAHRRKVGDFGWLSDWSDRQLEQWKGRLDSLQLIASKIIQFARPEHLVRKMLPYSSCLPSNSHPVISNMQALHATLLTDKVLHTLPCFKPLAK